MPRSNPDDMKPALLVCLVYFIPLSLHAFPQSGEEQLFSMLQINASYFDNDMSTEVEVLLEKAWNCRYDKAKAINLIAEAKQVALKSNYVEKEAKVDYIDALLQLYYGNKKNAQLLLTKSLEKLEHSNKGNDYVDVLVQRAKLNFYLGDIEGARKDFDSLLELTKKLGDLRTQAIVLSYQGKVAEAKNDFSFALGKYTQAFRISKSIGDEKTNTESLVLLGACYVKMGETEVGIEKLNKALALKQEKGDEEAEAQIMLLLASALMPEDDTKALKLAKKSLTLGKKLKNIDIKVEAYGIMEGIQVKRKNYEEAYHLAGLVNRLLQEAGSNAQSKDFLPQQNKAQSPKNNAVITPSEKLSNLNRHQVIIIALILVLMGIFCIRLFRTLEKTNNILNLKNEELEMSKTALEKFAYAASHDLKEPLRTIGSFSSLVSKRYAEKLGKEGGEYVDYITRGVDQMYNLLDDLRIYSSLFQDNIIPHRQVDLKEVLTAVELCAAENPEGGKVKIDIPDNLPSIMGNPIQMHHLFLNLVNNAIQHNDKTFPVVKIKCEEMEKVLLFKVIDNGNGIAEKYHEKIFYAFKRLSRKQKPGSGVGLAVCKKIVEKHHGCIWLDSKVGEGTTFSFTLPRKQMKHVPIFRRFQAHFNKSA